MPEITNINPLRVWVQHVLPLVYDDSLSYYELLCKVTDKINQLINNNNVLPEYIEQVVASQVKAFFETEEGINLLSPFVSEINVTDPPFGLASVSSTGNTDEHDRIMTIYNVCATKHIKMYFPVGVYLTSQLDLTGSVNIRGDGYAKTKIYGVEDNSGYVFNFSSYNGNITDLEINANVISQVQKPSCVFVSDSSDVYFGRVKFNNGYYCMVNEGRASINTGYFENAFFASYKDTSESNIRCINLTIFNNNPFTVASRNARFVGVEIVGTAKINAEGESGLYVINAGAEDSVNTSVTTNQIWVLDKYAKVSGKTANINFDNVNVTNAGDTTINSGDITLGANNITSSVAADKLSDVKGKRTVKSGTKEETVNGTETRTVTGKETETFGSRETIVDGANSETTHGNKTETVDNVKTVTANSETHTVTGKLELNAGQYKMLDVVRGTPTGTTNYADEAPFVDNAGNNKSLLVKGETDINAAINKLVTDIRNLDNDVSDLNGIPARVDALEANATTVDNDLQTIYSDIQDLERKISGITPTPLTTTTVSLPKDVGITGPVTTQITSFVIQSAGTYLLQIYARTNDENLVGYPYITTNPTTAASTDDAYFNLPPIHYTPISVSGTFYNPTVCAVVNLTARTWYLYCKRAAAYSEGTKISFPAGTCITLTRLSD